MRTGTNKMLISIVAAALTVPFFAISMIVVARIFALVHSAQDDLLLIALSISGVIFSIANGMGRRDGRRRRALPVRSAETDNQVVCDSNMAHLGF